MQANVVAGSTESTGPQVQCEHGVHGDLPGGVQRLPVLAHAFNRHSASSKAQPTTQINAPTRNCHNHFVTNVCGRTCCGRRGSSHDHNTFRQPQLAAVSGVCPPRSTSKHVSLFRLSSGVRCWWVEQHQHTARKPCTRTSWRLSRAWWHLHHTNTMAALCAPPHKTALAAARPATRGSQVCRASTITPGRLPRRSTLLESLATRRCVPATGCCCCCCCRPRRQTSAHARTRRAALVVAAP
jgi:hypothetical protein